MPSDANGVYTLPDGYLAVTGDTILASQHNPPLEDLAESMSQRVMASGAKPFTGPAKFADGTVTTPGITMASATSSGWYKTADGWGFSIGGAMVAEFTAGGIRTGAHYLGELIPFTGLTAPSLTVLPYGQTLSRTTYAALWAWAQVEIAAGNTFYNNGDGSITFGIGDLRGRVPAGKDNIGGVAAGRLTSITCSPNATTLGAISSGTSQGETVALSLAQLPTGITSSVTGNVTSANILTADSPTTAFSTGSSGATIWRAFSNGSTQAIVALVGVTGTATSNNTSGSAHGNVQPTIVTNYILFAGA